MGNRWRKDKYNRGPYFGGGVGVKMPKIILNYCVIICARLFHIPILMSAKTCPAFECFVRV